MIINVGGRTDIVNYYTPWLLNRLAEGYAYSRNPFARENVYKLSLKPEDVDCLLFCSKNYQPIQKHITKSYEKNLKQGFRYRYNVIDDGKHISISSVDLDKLKEKVKKRGYPWKKLN